MTNYNTIDKLIEMRLTSMSDAFRNQLNDPKMKDVPFEDRFGMLVDIEFSNCKNNRLRKLVKKAEFDQPKAYVGDIDYTSSRRLNKDLIKRIATCEYITEHRNLFTGATGCGKTYMSCAFGMEACKQYYSTKYIRLPDLLIDLEMSRNEGTYKKVMVKYANPVLLIIDEWLLLKPSENERRISSSFSIGEGRSHPPSSVPSTGPKADMSSWVAPTVLYQMPSWTGLYMMHTKSISKALTHQRIYQCVRYMDWISP